MNLSYSYYNSDELNNHHSIDPDDNLYNMALAVNNSGKMPEISPYEYEDKSISQDIPEDMPFFTTQGYYNNPKKSIKKLRIKKPKKSKKTDHDTIYTIPDSEVESNNGSCESHVNKLHKSKNNKFEHIKHCAKCKKFVMNMINKHNNQKNHVIDEYNNSINDYASTDTDIFSSDADIDVFAEERKYKNYYRNKYRNHYKNKYKNAVMYEQDNEQISEQQPQPQPQPQPRSQPQPKKTKNNYFKEIIMVLLIGVVIVLILDLLSYRRKSTMY